MAAKLEAHRLSASLGKLQSDLCGKQGKKELEHAHVCVENAEYCSCLAFIESKMWLMGTYTDCRAEALSVLL